MTKIIFLLFLSFLQFANAASGTIRSKNSYIPEDISDDDLSKSFYNIEKLAQTIRKEHSCISKDISDDDLLKSYSLISSVPKDLENELPPEEEKHKIIATFIDRDIEGNTLWHSFVGKKDLFDKILFSDKNTGNIDAIFKSLNNEYKIVDEEKYSDDKELLQYIEQQKRNLFIHVHKHFGLIYEKQITDLMKEGNNSMFLFFNKEEEGKDKKKWENNVTSLLTTALNHENIQYIQEENSSNGPCVVVYSKLPKLDHTKLLGSAILKAGDYRIIAVRNYRGECGVYLTVTVKIPFLIEKSNKGNLMRFRISSIYPCDTMIYSDKENKWIEPFSDKARMALINPNTVGIILDFLVNYNSNYKDTGKETNKDIGKDTSPLLDQYLQDIPLENSCLLDDLPCYLITSKIEYLWCLLHSNKIKFDNIEKDIEIYNKRYNRLETDINFLTTDRSAADSLSSTLNTKKEALKNIDLECKNLRNYIDKLGKIQIFINDLFNINKMTGNKFDGSLYAVKSAYEIYFLQLNNHNLSIVSMLKKAISLTDLLNNINIEKNIENPPPPLPDKKVKKKRDKKNKKPQGRSEEAVDENAMLDSYIEQSKKELNQLIDNYNEELKQSIDNYNEEYTKLKTNIYNMKKAVGKCFTFSLPDKTEAPTDEWEKNLDKYDESLMFSLPDMTEAQTDEWKKNLDKYDESLINLKEMYKKLENNFNAKKQIAQQKRSITQHDTQSSSLEASIINPTTIENPLVKLRQMVLKISHELKNKKYDEKN